MIHRLPRHYEVFTDFDNDLRVWRARGIAAWDRVTGWNSHYGVWIDVPYTDGDVDMYARRALGSETARAQYGDPEKGRIAAKKALFYAPTLLGPRRTRAA